MRGLLAAGVVAALATPLMVWQLADLIQARQSQVEVVGADLVVTSANADAVLPITRASLARFCREHNVSAPSDHDAGIQHTVKRWRRVNEIMEPSDQVAQRFKISGFDAHGDAWELEAVCGPSMSTLIFVRGECAGGPSRLTNQVADALRLALNGGAVSVDF